jgi:selenocysteine-specific elongation factor
VVARARLTDEQAPAALQEAVAEQRLVVLEEGELRSGSDLLMVAGSTWINESGKAEREVLAFHKSNPLRKGMSREELKSRLKLTARAFSAALRKWVEEGRLVELGSLVASPQHQVRFTAVQEAVVQRLLARFQAAPYTPPSVKEAQAEVGEALYAALVERGDLVQVSLEVVFQQAAYLAMKDFVQQYLASHEGLSAAEFRDRFNTSRKYALGLLEYLDAVGLTIREGDFRRLRKKT